MTTRQPCELAPIQCSQDLPYLRCIHCGTVYSQQFLLESSRPICSSPDHHKKNIPLPNILVRFKNYAKAFAHYMATGQKQATEPQLLERFQQCSRCDYYNDLEGACSVCGCYVNLCTGSMAPNKALWAIEQCPLVPPKWLKIET